MKQPSMLTHAAPASNIRHAQILLSHDENAMRTMQYHNSQLQLLIHNTDAEAKRLQRQNDQLRIEIKAIKDEKRHFTGQTRHWDDCPESLALSPMPKPLTTTQWLELIDILKNLSRGAALQPQLESFLAEAGVESVVFQYLNSLTGEEATAKQADTKIIVNLVEVLCSALKLDEHEIGDKLEGRDIDMVRLATIIKHRQGLSNSTMLKSKKRKTRT